MTAKTILLAWLAAISLVPLAPAPSTAAPVDPAASSVPVDAPWRSQGIPARAQASFQEAKDDSFWGRTISLGIGLLVGVQAARAVAPGPVSAGIGALAGGLLSQVAYFAIFGFDTGQ